MNPKLKRILVAVLIAVGISITMVILNSAVANATVCNSYSASRSWGTWPYNQTVTDHSYICVDRATAKITYKSTYVDSGSPLCTVDDRYHYTIGGGVGTYYIDWVDGSHMTCPTNIPFIFVHRDDQMAIMFAISETEPSLILKYKVYWTN